MLLRASSEHEGRDVDLHAVTDGEHRAGSGIPHGEALIRFAEAAVRGSDSELALARQQVLDELGPEPLVDAAAIVGNFQRMVRIADATGIPLDGMVNRVTADLRAEIGIEKYGSAANTPRVGGFTRLVSRWMGPIATRMLRRLSPIASQKESG